MTAREQGHGESFEEVALSDHGRREPVDEQAEPAGRAGPARGRSIGGCEEGRGVLGVHFALRRSSIFLRMALAASLESLKDSLEACAAAWGSSAFLRP